MSRAADDRPGFAPVDEPERYLAPLCERFGFAPQTFAGYGLLRHSRDYLSIAPAAICLPSPPPQSGLEGVGLLFLRIAMAVPKLTTAAAIAFGGRATRNVVELSRARAELYLRRDDLELLPAELEAECSAGPQIVRSGGLALGTAFLRTQGRAAVLESQFPRAWKIG